MKYLIQIKGITKSEYPDLYHAIGKYGTIFNIEEVEIKILETGMKADAIKHYKNVLRVSDKLIDVMNGDQIEAIVAHELRHIKNLDFIVKSPIIVIVLALLIGFLYAFIKIYLCKVSFVNDILSLLLLSSNIIIGIMVLHWVSIQQEFRADRESSIETGKPDSLKTALEIMHSERFPGRRIIEKLDSCNYRFTHPDLKKRIEYLELLKKRL